MSKRSIAQTTTFVPKRAVGVIGGIELHKGKDGYLVVDVPLVYDYHGRTGLFTGQFLLRKEWLTKRFTDRVKARKLTRTERIQYDINVSGYLKGLFASAGIEKGQLDLAMLKNRTTRLPISTRFIARQSSSILALNSLVLNRLVSVVRL